MTSQLSIKTILPGFLILATALAACGGATTASPSQAAAPSAAPLSTAPGSGPASIAPAPVASASTAPSVAPKPAASSPPASASTSPAASAPTTVQLVTDARWGQILADPRGMTLYVYNHDTKGVSTCNDACSVTWPPLVAFGPSVGPAGVTGVLDVMTRTDGKKQITWNGAPLYTFSGDTKPGESTGSGIAEGSWKVVTATSNGAASASVSASGPTTVQVTTDPKLGKILADPRGMTLYTNKQDQKGVSNCGDACSLIWPPLLAFGPSYGPPGVSGVLDVMTRSDGKKQITWNELPLYTYSKDAKPGETTGNGIGGVWQVVPAA